MPSHPSPRRLLSPLAALLLLTAAQACSSDEATNDQGSLTTGQGGAGGTGGTAGTGGTSGSGAAGSAGSTAGSGGSGGQSGSSGASGQSGAGGAGAGGAGAGGEAGQSGASGQAGAGQSGAGGEAGAGGSDAGAGGAGAGGTSAGAGGAAAGAGGVTAGAGGSSAGAGGSVAGAGGSAGQGGSPATCDNSKVHVAVVLDRSNSMRVRPEGGTRYKNSNQWTKSKLAIAVGAVNKVVGQFVSSSAVQYNFALNLFPDDNDCPSFKETYGCLDYPTKNCNCAAPTGMNCTTPPGATFQCEYKDDPILGAGCYLAELDKGGAACAAKGDITEFYLGDKKFEDVPMCGSTPIGFALQASGDVLQKVDSVYPRAVVLVTDGGETCLDKGSDPLKVVTDLYGKGIRTHVVTFNATTTAKLQPVADAGNGGVAAKIFEVSSKDDTALDELSGALKEIITTVQCKL